jgi:hypothetical protein
MNCERGKHTTSAIIFVRNRMRTPVSKVVLRPYDSLFGETFLYVTNIARRNNKFPRENEAQNEVL